MKIGIVLPYAIHKRGGVLEVALAQQEELLRRGHEAYIITPRPRGYDDDNGLHDHAIFVGNSIDSHALAQQTTVQISFSLKREIDEMLAREQFDILHFHEPWVPFLGLQMLPRSRTVNVATFHANMPETMMAKTAGMAASPFAKPLIKYLDAMTATGEAAAMYTHALTDRPITLVPLGIDQELYRAPDTFDDDRPHKTILYIGRLEGRKGVKYLIKAFALLQTKHPDTTLFICSDGPDRDKLEWMVEDLGLKNVHFKGYISQEDKLKYLRECDLYCSPAIYGEGFGIVLLEALSTRAVTVAGDNLGYAGVMSGFGEISLVDPKHEVEFARRLSLLLYQPELRKLWRKWATAELPKYTWSAMVDQYLEVYKQALRTAKKR